MEPRVAACMRGRQAARRRIELAKEAVGQARVELAGVAEENRCGVLLAFLNLQMTLALKALSTDGKGARIVPLRPAGGGR
jgi:hypothetical protein